jgi:hypothetical protein
MKLVSRVCIIALVLVFLIVGSVSGGSIIGNSDWYGRPHLVDVGDGVWAMIYRDAYRHTGDPDGVFHIRFSDDEGASWTADDTKLGGGAVTGFPIEGYEETDSVADGILIKAPNGDLLCHISAHTVDESDNIIAVSNPRQWRSTDGGETWSHEGVIVRTSQDYFVLGSDIYVTGMGGNYGGPYQSILYKSTDNGLNWTKVSDITSTDDETNESGIEYMGDNTILAILRDDNEEKTYQRISADMGATWGSLEDITSQLAVFQRPRLHRYNGRVYLIGRDAISLTERYTALYYTDSGGTYWQGPFYMDEVGYVDSAYCEMLPRSTGEFYMLSYAGTKDDADIMEYIFEEQIYVLNDDVGQIIMAGDKVISFTTFSVTE